MAFQFSLQFESQGYGWQELLYSNSANINAAAALLNPICAARARGLGPGAFIRGVYVRDVTRVTLSGRRITQWPYQESQWFPWSQGIAATKNGQLAGTNADIPVTSLRLRVVAQGTYVRNMWIRGISDQWVAYNPDGTVAILQAAYNFFSAYINVLNAQGIGWLALVRGNQNAPAMLTGVSTDASGRVTVLVSNSAPFIALDKCLVSGARGTNLYQTLPGRKGVNGVHTIWSVSGNTLTLDLLASTLTGSPVWTGGGQVFPRDMQFVQIDRLIGEDKPFLFIAEKRPGKIVTNSRGRSRVNFRNS